ncbi:MAG: YARHG domain-containing protein [Lachnospiraceae bacterium]|nr:YARHG domain-containing protein [Lachnospiraceae bacterium]
MSDKTPKTSRLPKGVIIAIIIIASIAALCIGLLIASRLGLINTRLINTPFVNKTRTSRDRAEKNNAEARGDATVIDQPVEKLTDYSSLAGDIKESKSSTTVDSGKTDSDYDEDEDNYEYDEDSYTDEDDDSEADEDSDKDYILADSSDKSISKSDIKSLSNYDLRIAINEIYARHGYTFQAADLNDYFNNKDWYEPDSSLTDMNDVKISKIEKKNLDKMSAERSKRKKDGDWPY